MRECFVIDLSFKNTYRSWKMDNASICGYYYQLYPSVLVGDTGKHDPRNVFRQSTSYAVCGQPQRSPFTRWTLSQLSRGLVFLQRLGGSDHLVDLFVRQKNDWFRNISFSEPLFLVASNPLRANPRKLMCG